MNNTKSISYELDVSDQSIWNYISATPAAISSFVYLQEAGYFYARPKYFTTRRGLDSFLIKLTVSGGGILEYNGRKEKIGQGQFFWIDCEKWQNYYTDPEIGHWNVIWAHFRGVTARSYYDTYLLLNNNSNVTRQMPNSSMYNLLETLLNRYPNTQDPFGEKTLLEFDVKTSGIITQLMTECIANVSASNEYLTLPPVVQVIRSFLVSNYNQKITLEDLSQRFSLNPYYLQKLFKQYIGQSPTEYLIYLRMTKAKMLIRSTPMPISEIAYSVGIDNISHFTRLFKKREGLTPLEYRKFWPVFKDPRNEKQ